MVSQTCRMLRISSESDSIWEHFAHEKWKKELKEKISWKTSGNYKKKFLIWIRQQVEKVQRGVPIQLIFNSDQHISPPSTSYVYKHISPLSTSYVYKYLSLI